MLAKVKTSELTNKKTKSFVSVTFNKVCFIVVLNSFKPETLMRTFLKCY